MHNTYQTCTCIFIYLLYTDPLMESQPSLRRALIIIIITRDTELIVHLFKTIFRDICNEKMSQ